MSDRGDVPALIVWIFMWVSWVGTGFMCVLGFVFLHGGVDFSWVGEKVDVFAGMILLLPIGFSLVLRFWAVPRGKGIWLKLVLFLMAMFTTYFILMTGIFLLPGFMGLLTVLAGVSLLVWFPQFVRLRPREAKHGVSDE